METEFLQQNSAPQMNKTEIQMENTYSKKFPNPVKRLPNCQTTVILEYPLPFHSFSFKPALFNQQQNPLSSLLSCHLSFLLFSPLSPLPDSVPCPSQPDLTAPFLFSFSYMPVLMAYQWLCIYGQVRFLLFCAFKTLPSFPALSLLAFVIFRRTLFSFLIVFSPLFYLIKFLSSSSHKVSIFIFIDITRTWFNLAFDYQLIIILFLGWQIK